MDTVERGAIRQEMKEQQQQHHQNSQSSQASSTPYSAQRSQSDSSSSPDNDTLNRKHIVVDLEKGSEECPDPTSCTTGSCHASKVTPLKGLSILDRFLPLWIILAMALGIILSNLVPATGPALQQSTFVDVSVPIAVGLLVMMYPILCKVRYETLHLVFKDKKIWMQIIISIGLNWIIAPLFMTGLAWAFLPDRPDLREGLIMVGIARCIAMVLIWTDLSGGNIEYCAILVAINSILQMVLFAPFSIFFLRVISNDYAQDVTYPLVARSVAVFLGIPLAAAILTRLILKKVIRLSEAKYQTFLKYLGPWSLIGLLYTIIVLFGSQGAHVVRQITDVLRVVAPLVVYFAVIFTFTGFLCYKAGYGYKLSVAQSFTAASNNFELAIAVVVAVWGAGSGQALASTVGPLVEVPVLVALVYVARWVRGKLGWKD